jgi:hypothetical protein
MLDWAEQAAEAAANARCRAASRLGTERETRAMRSAAEARMTCRTATGRRYEEHRCGLAPWSVRLRRYGPQVGAAWSAHEPYVWELVRVVPPDEWLGDGESDPPMSGLRDEPRFCPWCGEMLDRCPDEIRGLRL